jgi:hypothetical protein
MWLGVPFLEPFSLVLIVIVVRALPSAYFDVFAIESFRSSLPVPSLEGLKFVLVLRSGSVLLQEFQD